MTATPRAIELTEIAAAAAADKLAQDIVAFDVSEQLAITDVFLLCSGANDRQVRAIIDEVELRLKQRRNPRPPRGRGGEPLGAPGLRGHRCARAEQGRARVLLAQGPRIWKDCPVIPLPEAALAGNTSTGKPGESR